ncbi:MAG: hypothetical protein KF699_03680 [Phycisphaeraceae bacterium]|nr:hypothetical protein [Phycisphaeraceae bacterium]MBX3405608.1 hypothetical protein [Phycisphaeraceae bacterium]
MLACFIILIAATGPFVGWWTAARLGEALIDRGDLRGECAACGYDRAGLAADQLCPECGLDATTARASLDRRHFLCAAVVMGFAVTMSVLFVLLGQPLTLGEEAWGCAGVLVPLGVLALLGTVPRVGRRGWIILALVVPALVVNLVFMVPAYADLALNQRPGPYGRGFALQIVPLAVGVIGVSISGWGVAAAAWAIALVQRVRLRRPLTETRLGGSFDST